MKNEQEDTTTERTQRVRAKGEEALREGREAAAQGVEKAAAAIDDQKSNFAAQIADISQAAHNTADDLREREQGYVADWVEQAADGLHRVSESLRDNDLKTMYGEVEDFARRQPAIFIAGTALLGFAAARFAKASSERSSDSVASADRVAGPVAGPSAGKTSARAEAASISSLQGGSVDG